MRTFGGVDLGSTTTKAVVLDADGRLLGRGVTNSRSNYALATAIAREEALVGARFELLSRRVAEDAGEPRLVAALRRRFRVEQHLAQLDALGSRIRRHARSHGAATADDQAAALDRIFSDLERHATNPLAPEPKSSEFFRDLAASRFLMFAAEK